MKAIDSLRQEILDHDPIALVGGARTMRGSENRNGRIVVVALKTLQFGATNHWGSYCSKGRWELLPPNRIAVWQLAHNERLHKIVRRRPCQFGRTRLERHWLFWFKPGRQQPRLPGTANASTELEFPSDLDSDRTRIELVRGRLASCVHGSGAHDPAPFQGCRQLDGDVGALSWADARGTAERVDGKCARIDHRDLRTQERPHPGREGLSHRIDHWKSPADSRNCDVRRRGAIFEPEIQRSLGPAFDVDDVSGGRRAHGSGAVSFHVSFNRARDQPPDRGGSAHGVRLELGFHAGHPPQVV